MIIADAYVGLFSTKLPNGQPVISLRMNKIHTESYPVVLDPFALAFTIYCEPTDAGQNREVTVRMITEDGKPMWRFELKMNLPQTLSDFEKPYSQVVEVANLKVPKPGDYEFDIRIDDRQVAAVPLMFT